MAWPLFQRSLIVAIFGLAILTSFSKSKYTIGLALKDKETIELIHYIATNIPSGSNIALIPFLKPFDTKSTDVAYLLLPYWIETLTQANVQSLMISLASNRTPHVERELALGWLFSGDLSLIGSCPDLPLSTKDMISGARFYNDYQRVIDCEIAPRIKNTMNPCQILSKFPVEFLLWDADDKLNPPASSVNLTTTVWVSSAGRYTLKQLNLEAAQQALCN
jgi:hypothetical protein